MKAPMKVLIVDDDVHVRLLLRELMEELQEEVVECTDGREAVEFCRDVKPDIVLMDVRMPGMNGIEATREITDMHEEILVFIVTQYDNAEYRESARKAGAAKYFLKDDLFHLQDYLRGLHGAENLN